MKICAYILLLLVLFLGACQDPFEPDLSDQERTLIVMSNLIAGESPVADVKSTVLLGDPNAASAPEDAIISIVNVNDNSDFIPLRYDSQLGLYTNPDRTIFDGVSYLLTVDVPSFDSKTLTSITTVPLADFVDLEVINVEQVMVQDEQAFRIDIDLDLTTLSLDTHYLKLGFFLEEFITIVDSNGVSSQVLSENSTYMTCNDLHAEVGVSCLEHNNSFLVDARAVSGDIVSLSLLSKSHEEDASVAGRLILELSTLSQSNYLFHLNVTDLINSTESVISEPVLNYTNINNGYGYFGASNVKRDTILL